MDHSNTFKTKARATKSMMELEITKQNTGDSWSFGKVLLFGGSSHLVSIVRITPPFIRYYTPFGRGPHNPRNRGRKRSPWLVTTYPKSNWDDPPSSGVSGAVQSNRPAKGWLIQRRLALTKTFPYHPWDLVHLDTHIWP